MVTVVGIDESLILQKPCRNCASVLRYTPSEEKRGKSTDYSGSTDHFSYIVCPKCDEWITTRNW